MPAVKAKLVTIVTVYGVQDRVVDGLGALGVQAYSIAHVEGRGRHGRQRGGLFGNENVSISVVTNEETAARILAWAEHDFVPHHPGIAYSADVTAVLQSRPVRG